MTDVPVDPKEALKARLPHGWLAKAQERLASKKKYYSPATISRVKNLQFQNEDIMDVLLELAAEEDVRKQALAARMRGQYPNA